MAEDAATPAPTRTPRPATAAKPSKIRLALAFLVAAASDAVSYGTEWVPPVQWAVDLTTALLLFGLLGWRWALLPGLVAEAIPGVAAFPVWVLVVAAVALWGEIQGMPPRPRPRVRGSPLGGRDPRLAWAVVCLVMALVAAVFGFGGIVAAAAGMAKVLCGLFLFLFVSMLVLDLRGRRTRHPPGAS
jgi:uncharacterized membrane protein YtjA (UPF0391 family)